MRRRLFTFISVVSTVLFVVTCVLWVRSYKFDDRISWHAYGIHAGGTFTARSLLGGLHIERQRLVRVKERMDASPVSVGWDHYTIVTIQAEADESGAIPLWLDDDAYRQVPWWTLGFDMTKRNIPVMGLSTGDLGQMEIIGGVVPSWFLATATSVLPALKLGAAWRRHRRRRRGRCLTCGYDLTANESGRCPECGIELTVTA